MKHLGKILMVLIIVCLAGAIKVSASKVATVREDRFWVYRQNLFNAPELGGSIWNKYVAVFHFMRFQGTETTNDRVYSKFVCYKMQRFLVSESLNEAPIYSLLSESDDILTMCYMSEEDGIIYQLGENGELCTAPTLQDDSTFTDIIIYDWNLSSGETWYDTPFNQPWSSLIADINDCVITELPSMEIGGEECKFFCFPMLCSGLEEDGLTFIQGVGPVFNGWLGEVNPSLASGHTDILNLCGVFSLDGSLLYGSNPPTAGMTSIIKDHDSTKEIYSLQGIRVDNPQPGSIYIRNGKKFVAR